MKNKFIQLLQENVKNHPEKYNFFAPADAIAIRTFEKENSLLFPVSYKEFLSIFNGGFINMHPDISDIETAAWNSNVFLGIEEIAGAYSRIEYKFNDEKKFIPFMHTKGQEYLGFMFPFTENKIQESKVYDLWHEAFPSEWESQAVYESFEELLEEYVDLEGNIETMG